MNRTDGVTKLVIDPFTDRVIGVGIVGVNASDLIAEGTLAVEMRASAADLALTVHAHPTLPESIKEAGDAFSGLSTHIYKPKKPLAR